ncbi:MAG: hypothetical protein HY514_02040 [Candidatus Aenigmarchaeota archaeon]|nr:hypothetical protein [Candidatus Aenigmarchaeota archaeon]
MGHKIVDRLKRKYLTYALGLSILLPSVGIFSKPDAERVSHPITQYNLQQPLYQPLSYKQALDVFVDNVYTHPSAWAHTIPEEKRICIRDPAFIDYNLTFSRVLGHEIGHNIRHFYGVPDGDEDHHTRHAYQHLAHSPFELRSRYPI